MGRVPLPRLAGKRVVVLDEIGVKHEKSYPGRRGNWSIVGGPITMLGNRKADQKPVAFGPIDGVLKQDWTRTGNIDFHVSAIESSSPQPIRLLVEEKRVMESVVGQDIVELRWRLATLVEGKELVVCWKRANLTT
jgi:hypothetical protein